MYSLNDGRIKKRKKAKHVIQAATHRIRKNAFLASGVLWTAVGVTNGRHGTLFSTAYNSALPHFLSLSVHSLTSICIYSFCLFSRYFSFFHFSRPFFWRFSYSRQNRHQFEFTFVPMAVAAFRKKTTTTTF